MLRLKDLPPAEMDEVVRVASELYQRDQREKEDAQERQHVVDAAEEVGLPGEYLELAAAEIHQRKVAEIVEKRRRRRGWFMAMGLAGGLAAALTISVVRSPAPTPVATTAPLTVESFDANPALRWELNHNTRTSASLKFSTEASQGGVAVLQVNRFVPGQDGKFFANLDMTQGGADLSGRTSLAFQVRGTGLPRVRLYLENGPLERWRSPALPVPKSWELRTAPLSQFEYQARKSATDPWRVQRYQAPKQIQRFSFKVGDFVNEVGARGEVALDNLRAQ